MMKLMRVLESNLYDRLLKLLNEKIPGAPEAITSLVKAVEPVLELEVPERVDTKPELISTGSQTDINTPEDPAWRSFDKFVSEQTGQGLKLRLKTVKSKPIKKKVQSTKKRSVRKKKQKCRRK